MTEQHSDESLGELFRQFAERLAQNYELDKISQEALACLAGRLCFGKVLVVLHVPQGKFTPQGEDGIYPCYLAPDGRFEESGAFEKDVPIAEGGSCCIHVFPVPGHLWTQEERSWLDVMCVLLVLHGARFRLSQKVRQSFLTNYISGLPNSGGFLMEIGRYVRMQTVNRFDVFYFNLRGFGLINRTFGKLECDRVIVRYAGALLGMITQEEIVAHFGGDNFAALIIKEHSSEFLKNILHMQTFAMRNEEKVPLTISAMVGIYSIEDKLSDPEVIMTEASAALSIARQNKLEYVRMTPEMSDRVNNMKRVNSVFPSALRHEEFFVYYQPKVNAQTGMLVGAEALARWIQNGTPVQPYSFIPVLEQSGAIMDLDLYLLERVCRHIREWKRKGMRTVPISVNFSRKDITGEGRSPERLVEAIQATLAEYDIQPDEIIAEVTETTESSEQKSLLSFFQRMHDAGIATSIDDFGTGYSSLSVLRDFPVSEIKMDRSFINHDVLDGRDSVIIDSIIRMAKELGLHIITEGVETQEQLDFLMERGCSCIQGFLFDRPLPQELFERRLDEPDYYKKTKNVNISKYSSKKG